MTDVYLYSHVFSVTLAPPEPVPVPIFIRAKEPFKVTDIIERWRDPYGTVSERIIPAEKVADMILSLVGGRGVIRLAKSEPSPHEIRRSLAISKAYAVGLLQNWKTISDFARTRGSSPGPPSQAIIQAARFIHESGVEVSKFGLDKSLVDIVLAEARLGPEAELETALAEPSEEPKKTKKPVKPRLGEADFSIDSINAIDV